MHGVLQCSFCEKKQSEVKRIIHGGGEYICDECVHLCFDILQEYEDTRIDLIAWAIKEGEDEILSSSVGDSLNKLNLLLHNVPLRNFLLDCGVWLEKSWQRKNRERSEKKEERIRKIDEEIKEMQETISALKKEKEALRQK